MIRNRVFLWLFIIPVVVIPVFCATNPDSLMAEKTVAWLQHNQLDSLESHFTEQMQQALPLEKLQQVWSQIRTQYGALQSWTFRQLMPVQQYQVALIAGQFANGQLLIKVTLDAHHRIAGLFFQPLPSGQSTPSPEQGTSFKEIPVEFGLSKFPLKGLITIPKDRPPKALIILVHGSGPQDMDETVGKVKVFRDLARGLAQRNIATLRYHKRTYLHLDKISLHTITVEEEVLEDVREAVKFIRENPTYARLPLFVLGHSLGGSLMPVLLEQNPEFRGGIIMAGTVRPLTQVAIDQLTYLQTPPEKLKPLVELAHSIENHQAKGETMFLGAPAHYYYHLESLELEKRIQKVQRPLLIMNGGKDYQVTQKDFAIYQNLLKDRPNVTFRWYPELSHLFTVVKGKPSPQDYMKEAHVEARVMDDIARWIEQHLP